MNGQTTNDEKKEVMCLEIMQRIEERGLKQNRAAEMLKASERHIDGQELRD